MKIVMSIFKFFSRGGLQLDFMRIAMELCSRGHQVVCCAGKWVGDLPENLDCRTIPLHSFTNYGKAVEFERKMKSFLDSENPDCHIAFNRMAYSDIYFAGDNCVANVYRQKHAQWILDLLPRYRTFLRMEQSVFAPGARTEIFYIVDRQKEEYIDCYHTEPERFLYLPPGMNSACRRPANALDIRRTVRAELGVESDELLMILVASNAKLKGADRVIQAMAFLPENIRKKSKLLLCGDENAEPLLHFAEKMGVRDRIIHIARTCDVPSMLQAADLMVHPARQEAAGAVLIESIAAGVPVVCSGVCGFANFVEESGGCVLPEPFLQEDLFGNLVRILSEPLLLAEMKARTIDYGACADFYRRAEVAADFVEKYVEKAKKNRKN